ncbi:MAG: dihydrofolate reductase [Candidatus Woesearchaeota archaeon]|nr:dihydrofolate reductase [Candidatus Woesearchaeota archaeon]
MLCGRDNRLPWHLSDDLKNFKKLTVGNTVIMGRKTFESIGRPLPERNNIVISSSMPPAENITVAKTIEEALQKAESFSKEIFIIGGASVYAQSLPFADRLYLSFIKKDYDGDVYFPEFDMAEWKIENKTDYPDFELVIFARNGTSEKV